VILGTGYLLTLRNVARASMVAMMAGSRTSSRLRRGKKDGECHASGWIGDDAGDSGNTRSRPEWRWDLSRRAAFAPRSNPLSGWLEVDERESWARPWLNAKLFRLGASSMLADMERQLEFHATGRYSAEYRHPLA